MHIYRVSFPGEKHPPQVVFAADDRAFNQRFSRPGNGDVFFVQTTNPKSAHIQRSAWVIILKHLFGLI